MGVDVSIWRHFPFAEVAALLLFAAAYASGFHVLVARRLQVNSGLQPGALVLVGGLGFAAIALLLQSATLVYLGQPPSSLELGLLAIGFLAMGLAGSGLSVRWLRRQSHSGRATLRGTMSVIWRFWTGVIIALLLYHLFAGGLLLLLLT